MLDNQGLSPSPVWVSLSEEGWYLPKCRYLPKTRTPKCRYLPKTRTPKCRYLRKPGSRSAGIYASDASSRRPTMVDATPITKKKKGSKGLPKGITEHRSKKLQARLSYKGEDGKTIQRFIPGLFEDIDAAVAAQAAAYKVLDNDGPLAVWPPVTKPERKKRGEVRASPSPDLHRVLSA